MIVELHPPVQQLRWVTIDLQVHENTSLRVRQRNLEVRTVIEERRGVQTEEILEGDQVQGIRAEWEVREEKTEEN